MRGFVQVIAACVLAVTFCLCLSENTFAQQCNVQRNSASASVSSAADLQSQAALLALLSANQQRAPAVSSAQALSAAQRPVLIVPSGGGSSAVATAGTFATPAPAIDANQLSLLLRALQSPQGNQVSAVAAGGGGCNLSAGGRSSSRSVAVTRQRRMIQIVPAQRSRSVAISRS